MKTSLTSLLVAVMLLLCAGSTVYAGEDVITTQVCRDYFSGHHIDYNRATTLFNTEDALIASYVARHTGADLASIKGVFGAKRDWFQVMIHFGVKPETLFLPVPADYRVGPPYGNAYGYWKKHRQNPSTAIILTRTDILNLVQLNIIHGYFKTPVVDIIRYRSEGKPFTWIVNYENTRTGKIKIRNKQQDDNGGNDDKHKNKHNNKGSDDNSKSKENKGHGGGKGKGK